MKKSMFKYAWLLLVLVPLIFTSCKEDDPVPEADKTALVAKIADAETVYNNAEVGRLAGQYTQASVDAFKLAIDAAKAINADAAATQAQVDATTSNLQLAIDAFEDTVIVEISAENLVALWKFDGNGDDASGHGHDGTLMPGLTSANRFPDGGTPPTAVTDRHGNAGKALHFAHGANVEVPYDAMFNPDEMTISLWLNADSLSVSRTMYMMSLNIWNCWKFELPNHGKPFITRKLSNDVYIDKDSNPAVVEPLKWYHVVVTIDAAKCTFYFDGIMVVEWILENTAKPVAADPLINLVIGSFLPNDAEWDVAGWFTSFHGSMDDVRIYNKVLSASEVTALNTMEKPD